MRVRKISVVVPAYNEEKNIQKTVRDLLASLARISYDFELIVVCDGCKDRFSGEGCQIVKIASVVLSQK
jgi:glycosyltransferase involved in cell wall biosynthesis